MLVIPHCLAKNPWSCICGLRQPSPLELRQPPPLELALEIELDLNFILNVLSELSLYVGLLIIGPPDV